jgi:hypothetical protein
MYLVKSVRVLLIPIAKHKPIRNKVFPMAIKEASKRSTTPRQTNPRPKQINPIPIF